MHDDRQTPNVARVGRRGNLRRTICCNRTHRHELQLNHKLKRRGVLHTAPRRIQMHIQNDHRTKEPDEKRASGNNTTGSLTTNIKTTLSGRVSTTSADRITSTGPADDVSDPRPEYLTLVPKWDIGVTPKRPLRAVGGFSLRAVGVGWGVTPTALIVSHRCATNILKHPSPHKRGRDCYRMKKGTRVTLSHHCAFLPFSGPLTGPEQRGARRSPFPPFGEPQPHPLTDSQIHKQITENESTNIL
jgi:hypothetical protein